ncbi:MAG: type II toxin-antitoxin system RelE/ParE family toxin [Alphaproteobacteria bacterium]|nr:type II toxin-antitoxin system RelE/ParE family toxin [Alphaproteobacteria bacterium]
MGWTVKFTKAADKALLKLPPSIQIRLVEYLRTRVLSQDNPRNCGRSLQGDFVGLWRYRVGDYRLICKIEDELMLVLVIKLGHRGSIYDV